MREIKHLSVHQWLRSAIPDSQQPTSPIGFLFLKLHRLVRYYWYKAFNIIEIHYPPAINHGLLENPHSQTIEDVPLARFAGGEISIKSIVIRKNHSTHFNTIKIHSSFNSTIDMPYLTVNPILFPFQIRSFPPRLEETRDLLLPAELHSHRPVGRGHCAHRQGKASHQPQPEAKWVRLKISSIWLNMAQYLMDIRKKCEILFYIYIYIIIYIYIYIYIYIIIFSCGYLGGITPFSDPNHHANPVKNRTTSGALIAPSVHHWNCGLPQRICL